LILRWPKLPDVVSLVVSPGASQDGVWSIGTTTRGESAPTRFASA
jgi:hypothetical protein